MNRSLSVVILMLLLGLLTGCPPERMEPPGPPLTMPGDFALAFHVRNTDPTSTDPYAQTSQNVLETDRRLRAAVGPGASPDYFPPVTRLISPEQMEAVYRLAHEVRWQRQDDTPEMASATVVYTLSLRANGRTYNLVTTPDNAAAQRLLRRLVELRSPLSLSAPITTQPEMR